jgi:hypothetical protein
MSSRSGNIVCRQRHGRLELVVVDSASSDDSASFFASPDDIRVSWAKIKDGF